MSAGSQLDNPGVLRSFQVYEGGGLGGDKHLHGTDIDRHVIYCVVEEASDISVGRPSGMCLASSRLLHP